MSGPNTLRQSNRFIVSPSVAQHLAGKQNRHRMLPEKSGQLCAHDDFFSFLGTAGANVGDLERLEDRFGGELVGDKTPIGAVANFAAMGDPESAWECRRTLPMMPRA